MPRFQYTQYNEMPKHASLHYSVLIPHFTSCFLNGANCKEINFKVEEDFNNIKFFHVAQRVVRAKLTMDINWIPRSCWYTAM